MHTKTEKGLIAGVAVASALFVVFMVLYVVEVTKSSPSTSGKSRASTSKQRKHIWRAAVDPNCTKTCGGGSQYRRVYCFNPNGNTEVGDEFCDPENKPAAEQTCNTEECADWTPSSWGSCSTECDPGTQTRTVTCPDGMQCNPDTKPDATQQCNLDNPCGTWTSGSWQECDSVCGEGTQIRTVNCTTDICLGDKPGTTQTCTKPNCSWKGSNWNKNPQ